MESIFTLYSNLRRGNSDKEKNLRQEEENSGTNDIKLFSSYLSPRLKKLERLSAANILKGASTFSIMTLSITTQHNDTHHNDTHHNDTHHNYIQHNNKRNATLCIKALST
jgi:hypothetical protein